MTTELEVFSQIHEGMTQQAPGSERSTRRALELVPNLPQQPRILDIGCGPGRQTLTLAESTGGTVVAVDLMPAYLDQLRTSASERGLADRIELREESMTALTCDEEAFDLIWSEGAIYHMGFGAGLAAWQKFCRPGGAVAVTELCWLVGDPPEAAREFWGTRYPAMVHTGRNRESVIEAGYRLLGDFALPESDWLDGYYLELQERIHAMRRTHTDDGSRAALDETQLEIDVYRESAGAYGYVFYVMQRSA